MDKKQILLAGDSLIEYGPWEKWFGDLAVNRGIGGLTTEGVYLHLNRILRPAYGQIVLMAGVNDLMAGISEKEALANYAKILEKIKERQPGAQIYVHRPLPCNPEKLYLPLDNRRVEDLGRGLEALAKVQGACWVDLWDLLVKDGALMAAYTIDGVHLTEAAYDLWGARLSELLSA